MDATVEIKGLARLAQVLEQELPQAMAKHLIRDALQAGADVIAGAIESSAPGELAEDITSAIHVTSERSGLAGYALIGPAYDKSKLVVRKRGMHAGQADPTTSPGVFGLFVEKGHGPPGSHRERQRVKRQGRQIEFGDHETPPHPFMAPAFSSSKDAALEAIIDSLRDGVAEAAQSVAKQ